MPRKLYAIQYIDLVQGKASEFGLAVEIHVVPALPQKHVADTKTSTSKYGKGNDVL